MLNWLFNSKFNSITTTSKTCSDIYLKYLAQGLDDELARLKLISDFTSENLRAQTYPATEVTLLEGKCDKCLGLLIWSLICELPNNLQLLFALDLDIKDPINAVYKSVSSIAPNKVLLNDYEFYLKASEYLNYRANVYRILESNGSQSNTKYRVIEANKATKGTYCNDEDTYSEAKSTYLNWTENDSFSECVIYLAEMNGNRYVYFHDCNEKTVKDNLNKNAKNLRGKLQFSGIDFYE